MRLFPSHLHKTLGIASIAASAAALPFAASAAPSPATQAPASARQQPNIVFILADDLGWMDLGCQGSKYYESPNIDRLASQGMRFTTAYTMPNCAPTRACLWTGKYSPRTGIYTVGSGNRGQSRDRKLDAPKNVTNLSMSIPTLPEMLHGSGYTTGLFGKWHIGADKTHGPGVRGFDSVVRYDGSSHFNFTTKPQVEYPPGEFLADFLTDQGIAFMRKTCGEKKPFMLAITHFAVHKPLRAPEEDIAHFKDKPPAGGHKSAVYAGMIRRLDATVGRVVKELDRLGIADNTLIIFTSDNGGVIASDGKNGKGYVTDNTPLRGAKGTHYEGGIRVPFIARWPGVIKPGTTCDTPIIAVDFAPTVLDIAQHKADPGTVLDGLSYAPLMRGQPSAEIANRALFWHCPGYLEGKGTGDLWRSTPGGIIRQGPWKLIETFEDHRVELFNLADDLSETTDLSQKHPKTAAGLLARLRQWRADLRAPMPVPNPEYQKAPAKKQNAGT